MSFVRKQELLQAIIVQQYSVIHANIKFNQNHFIKHSLLCKCMYIKLLNALKFTKYKNYFLSLFYYLLNIHFNQSYKILKLIYKQNKNIQL